MCAPQVKVARAWFDYRAKRAVVKKWVVFKCSAAGCAFRAWLQLIDAKRRREFLEWALGGPDMSVLNTKLKSETKKMGEQIGDQLEEVKESIHGLDKRVNGEMQTEKRAVSRATDL